MDVGILIALASGAATLLTASLVMGWFIWREVRRSRRAADRETRIDEQ